MVVGTVESTQELDDDKFVVDCKKKVKPALVAGQDTITLLPELLICRTGNDWAVAANLDSGNQAQAISNKSDFFI